MATRTPNEPEGDESGKSTEIMSSFWEDAEWSGGCQVSKMVANGHPRHRMARKHDEVKWQSAHFLGI